ncbi:MAG: endonuclease III, partial [Prolixibacteraceae bacterium]|nr:endonuclease III [Prolixibacteraceae bacterium]
MQKKELFEYVIRYFENAMPIAETELEYTNPFDLIVAVILSAQCTDKRVNQITPELLKRFPTPQKMAEAEPAEVIDYIKSCSYPNNKAKHLVGMAQKLIELFDGEVPSDVT